VPSLSSSLIDAPLSFSKSSSSLGTSFHLLFRVRLAYKYPLATCISLLRHTLILDLIYQNWKKRRSWLPVFSIQKSIDDHPCVCPPSATDTRMSISSGLWFCLSGFEKIVLVRSCLWLLLWRLKGWSVSGNIFCHTRPTFVFRKHYIFICRASTGASVYKMPPSLSFSSSTHSRPLLQKRVKSKYVSPASSAEIRFDTSNVLARLLQPKEYDGCCIFSRLLYQQKQDR
jgi:hypothetical protein